MIGEVYLALLAARVERPLLAWAVKICGIKISGSKICGSKISGARLLLGSATRRVIIGGEQQRGGATWADNRSAATRSGNSWNVLLAISTPHRETREVEK